MSLGQEGRTVLKLVRTRRKGYDQIGDLLGIPADDARQRVYAALGELAGSESVDPDIAEYLLGRADQLDTAEIERRLLDDPDFAARVAEIEEQLSLVAPAGSGGGDSGAGSLAPRPVKAGSGGESSPAGRPGSPPLKARPRSGGLSRAQQSLIAILLGAALLAVILVLVLVGIPGGSDSSDQGDPTPTSAVMKPVGDAAGSGRGQIGFSGDGTLALGFEASDLEQLPKNEAYALWLHGRLGDFPIDQTVPDEKGVIGRQISLMGPELCLIAGGTFSSLLLTRASLGQLRKAQRQLRRSGNNPARLPEAVGTPILTGLISMPQEARDPILAECGNAGSE